MMILSPSILSADFSKLGEDVKRISEAGLVPILEPEVDINAQDKEKIEEFLHKSIKELLDGLPEDMLLMFKLTLPTKADQYDDLNDYENVVRVVALSGGYTREDSNKKLKENKRMIASFSRALSEGLKDQQTDEEFENMIADSIESIWDASVNK